MEYPIVESQAGVTLVGGGPLRPEDLRAALDAAPRLVAADGGANQLLEMGFSPEAVIGDLDSLSPTTREILAGRLHLIPEQVTTDFDKALRHISAPFVLALGFSGGRLDHELAALAALSYHPARICVLMTGHDLVFLAPKSMELRLDPGCRLSLFPLGAVHGKAEGLLWPLDGLTFTPDGRLGTSNEVSAPEVSLSFDAPKMLVILPQTALLPVLDALRHAELFRGV